MGKKGILNCEINQIFEVKSEELKTSRRKSDLDKYH